MGTSLFLITNAKLTGKETKENWDRIMGELAALRMNTTSCVDANNQIIKEHGNWSYYIDTYEDTAFSVEFEGPFSAVPSFYTNLGIINTIYRYHFLYSNYSLYWFESFRNDLYNIVKIMGGTEVIYLADNCCEDRKSVV